MGDTGSMFLGGLVVAMAFSIGSPLILAFVGIIYIVESLSVVSAPTALQNHRQADF